MERTLEEVNTIHEAFNGLDAKISSISLSSMTDLSPSHSAVDLFRTLLPAIKHRNLGDNMSSESVMLPRSKIRDTISLSEHGDGRESDTSDCKNIALMDKNDTPDTLRTQFRSMQSSCSTVLDTEDVVDDKDVGSITSRIRCPQARQSSQRSKRNEHIIQLRELLNSCADFFDEEEPTHQFSDKSMEFHQHAIMAKLSVISYEKTMDNEESEENKVENEDKYDGAKRLEEITEQCEKARAENEELENKRRLLKNKVQVIRNEYLTQLEKLEMQNLRVNKLFEEIKKTEPVEKACAQIDGLKSSTREYLEQSCSAFEQLTKKLEEAESKKTEAENKYNDLKDILETTKDKYDSMYESLEQLNLNLPEDVKKYSKKEYDLEILNEELKLLQNEFDELAELEREYWKEIAKGAEVNMTKPVERKDIKHKSTTITKMNYRDLRKLKTEAAAKIKRIKKRIRDIESKPIHPIAEKIYLTEKLNRLEKLVQENSVERIEQEINNLNEKLEQEHEYKKDLVRKLELLKCQRGLLEEEASNDETEVIHLTNQYNTMMKNFLKERGNLERELVRRKAELRVLQERNC